MKKTSLKTLTVLLIVGLFSIAIISQPASALVSQNITSWYSISDTNVSAMAIGDVNGDAVNEVVTVGWFNDGTQWNAQIIVRSSSNLAVLSSFSWHSVQDTQIASVAISDLNNDGINEIVTGGSFFDGTRWLSHLVVFDMVAGALTVTSQFAWYWLSDTHIASVAIGDVNGDGIKEIVTSGTFFDGTRQWAQLIVWSYSAGTFTPTSQFAWWYLSDTVLSTLAIGNVNGGTDTEIVTGGTRFDGTRWVAHLVVFNVVAGALSVTNQIVWYWISDTEISSIAIGDVNNDGSNEIVTGGSRFDNTLTSAQLLVFNGANLNVLNQYVWNYNGNTRINNVALGTFAATSGLDIITTGQFNDGTRDNAMVLDWYNIATGQNQAANWFTTSNTQANAAAIGNLGSGNRIVEAGSYFDLVRSTAQMTVWG